MPEVRASNSSCEMARFSTSLRGARALGLGQRELRARARQLGLRMFERRLVGTRIDHVKDVAFLDLVALLEARGRHVTRNARTHLDPFDRFEAAR